jgi:hypothetical protein
MKFLKVEWTKKRGAIALMVSVLVVSSFILGSYVATGNWNPWGNRHYYQNYYQILNANFQECYTYNGGTPQCQTTHNVIFNSSAIYIEKLVTSNNEGFCTVGASCSFHFIAMSSSATAPLAKYGSTGTTSTTSSGDCGAEGGTNVGSGTELTTNGFTAVAGTVTDIPAANGSPSSSTVVNTFTDATAATYVQQACLVNQAANGSVNRVDLAAATFPAITFHIADTIQITWTITWTWS